MSLLSDLGSSAKYIVKNLEEVKTEINTVRTEFGSGFKEANDLAGNAKRRLYEETKRVRGASSEVIKRAKGRISK